MSTTAVITTAILIHILLTTLSITLYIHLRNLERRGQLQTLFSTEEHVWTAAIRLFRVGIAWIRRQRVLSRGITIATAPAPARAPSPAEGAGEEGGGGAGGDGEQQRQQKGVAVTGIEPVISGYSRSTVLGEIEAVV